MIRRSIAPVLLVFVVGCSSPPKPTSAPAPGPTEPAAMLAAVEQSLVEHPDDGVLLYLRAALALESRSVTDALRFLDRLDATGWDVPLLPEDYAPLADNPRYREIAARIAARAVLVSRSSVVFTVPEPDLIPEGITVDPRTGTFYLGSLRKRKILAIDAQGKVSTFVPERRDGLLSPLGMKVDAARELLWVASYASRSGVGYTPAARTGSGVYAFALADGSLRRRVLFTGGDIHLPNDMAVAADGTVYVTDSVTGRLYRIPPDRDVLEPLMPANTLMYPNGIAPAPNGRLYVAHALGIAIVDPASGAVKRMETVTRAPLGGIDGLLLEGGALLAVQNGIGKQRMVAITLDSTGERATGLTVLENDSAALEIPTTACVADGVLYTIANSQLRAFGPKGLREGQTLADPRILRTPL